MDNVLIPFQSNGISGGEKLSENLFFLSLINSQEKKNVAIDLIFFLFTGNYR